MKRDRWVISELISLTNVDRFNRLVSGPLFFQETSKRCSTFNQSEARMRAYRPMREPKTESGSGTIQRCDPQEIQTSEAAWARMWHTKELILPHNQHLASCKSERREKKYFCILFLKPILFSISWYTFATIDPQTRQNSLMFCNASPQAVEPSDKIYTSLSLNVGSQAEPFSEVRTRQN